MILKTLKFYIELNEANSIPNGHAVKWKTCPKRLLNRALRAWG